MIGEVFDALRMRQPGLALALSAACELPTHTAQCAREQYQQTAADGGSPQVDLSIAMRWRQLFAFGQSDDHGKREFKYLLCAGVAPHAVPAVDRNRHRGVDLVRVGYCGSIGDFVPGRRRI